MDWLSNHLFKGLCALKYIMNHSELKDNFYKMNIKVLCWSLFFNNGSNVSISNTGINKPFLQRHSNLMGSVCESIYTPGQCFLKNDRAISQQLVDIIREGDSQKEPY